VTDFKGTLTKPLSNGAMDAQLLVESIADYAIFRLDTEGKIASWNAGAQRIKGYTAAEIIGKHLSILYRPEDVAAGKVERELETARLKGRCEDEGYRVRRDGTIFWANVSISAIYANDGTLTGYAKVSSPARGVNRDG
jgi:PAS domain S-box-containing protein